MSVTDIHIETLQFNRGRTLALLDGIAEMPDPSAVLAWRPGPQRAHVGWQLMHIGVTEEIFATERLAPEKERTWEELWPRFRGGSTPDDNVPTVDGIREVLIGSREHLLTTLRQWGDARLDEIPEAFKQRGLNFRQILSLLAYHEAHHHGQAHITLNLYKAAHGG